MHTLNFEINRTFSEHNMKYDTLLEIVKKKKKLRWYGHAMRAKGTMTIIITNTILQSEVEVKDNKEDQQDRVWTI